MKAYSLNHANKTNLLIHLFAVPLFILANVSLVISVAKLKPLPALTSMGLIALSLVLQRQGHKLEDNSPEPFKNGWDFATRLYTEQFYTFPKFLISGQYQKNFCTANTDPSQQELSQ